MKHGDLRGTHDWQTDSRGVTQFGLAQYDVFVQGGQALYLLPRLNVSCLASFDGHLFRS